MEEYMEFELSGIFWVNVATKNIVLGSLGTLFMDMRVNKLRTYKFKKIGPWNKICYVTILYNVQSDLSIVHNCGS